MNDVIFSILLVVVGLFVGAFIMLIINRLKVSAAQKEADKLIHDAKKEAEKAKRDGILELKEESYKLKNQTDAEIKEKKKELQEKDAKMESIIKEQIALLEKISGFSKEKARDLVMKKVEEEMSRDIASYLKER